MAFIPTGGYAAVMTRLMLRLPLPVFVGCAVTPPSKIEPVPIHHTGSSGDAISISPVRRPSGPHACPGVWGYRPVGRVLWTALRDSVEAEQA